MTNAVLSAEEGSRYGEPIDDVKNGETVTVHAVAAGTVSVENYPTRVYDTFSLPAGEYLSLKITIGSGEGKNWWCVVFPTLCLPAASQDNALLALPDGEREVVESQGDYQVKWKAVELWQALREFFRE